MDNRAEIREFLASRRAKITPERAGLPAGGGRRRVPGLRREEVAVLAGVSTDWYIRLEKGHISGVSDDVLDAVARALQLDEAERIHLYDLARAARPAKTLRKRIPPVVHATILRMLASMTDLPAFVRNGRLDVVAINPLGRALYSPVFESSDESVNLARFAFLDPHAQTFYPDWDEVAASTAAVLRAEAGRDPYDRGLSDLIGELATRSEPFRQYWASHDVMLHQTGGKTFQHPIVGRIEVEFDSMALLTSDAAGLTLTCYSPAPQSPSADALRLLASWAATTSAAALTDRPGPGPVTDRWDRATGSPRRIRHE